MRQLRIGRIWKSNRWNERVIVWRWHWPWMRNERGRNKPLEPCRNPCPINCIKSRILFRHFAPLANSCNNALPTMTTTTTMATTITMTTMMYPHSWPWPNISWCKAIALWTYCNPWILWYSHSNQIRLFLQLVHPCSIQPLVDSPAFHPTCGPATILLLHNNNTNNNNNNNNSPYHGLDNQPTHNHHRLYKRGLDLAGTIALEVVRILDLLLLRGVVMHPFPTGPIRMAFGSLSAHHPLPRITRTLHCNPNPQKQNLNTFLVPSRVLPDHLPLHHRP
mmetsp:Transcript_27101/g.49313  ORF Transcript_27101/g.49313 Transcript_27101/m.49313 type:complete len:277 (-) Transcript_27101:99-929(-)